VSLQSLAQHDGIHEQAKSRPLHVGSKGGKIARLIASKQEQNDNTQPDGCQGNRVLGAEAGVVRAEGVDGQDQQVGKLIIQTGRCRGEERTVERRRSRSCHRDGDDCASSKEDATPCRLRATGTLLPLLHKTVPTTQHSHDERELVNTAH
jgi:hypothetical protein